MIQNFLAQTTAPTAVWCYIVILMDHNLQQLIVWATPATLEMLPVPNQEEAKKAVHEWM